MPVGIIYNMLLRHFLVLPISRHPPLGGNKTFEERFSEIRESYSWHTIWSMSQNLDLNFNFIFVRYRVPLKSILCEILVSASRSRWLKIQVTRLVFFLLGGYMPPTWLVASLGNICGDLWRSQEFVKYGDRLLHEDPLLVVGHGLSILDQVEEGRSLWPRTFCHLDFVLAFSNEGVG
jgi:hypothetical protein